MITTFLKNISLYKRKNISVEYLNLKMKFLELKNNDLSRIVDNDFYKL